MFSARSLSAAVLALSCSASALAAPQVIEIRTSSPDPQATSLQSNPAVSRSNTELLMIVEQLQDEVRNLRGQLEQQTFRMKKMEQQQLDRYRDLDRRISALMSAGAQTVKPPAAVSNDSDNPAPVAPDAGNTAAASVVTTTPAQTVPAAVPVAPKPAPKPEPVTVKNGVSDSKAYRDAFALVRTQDYPAAIAALKAFVRDYPGSARVANAYYWLGEIYHVEQKLELAREAYALVLGQYPDHPKTPRAAYKLGVIYAELGDATRSQEYIDYVLKNHPDSKVAPLAQDLKRK